MEVAVEPGCPHEHSYIFHGMADEHPGILAGDIHVRITIEKSKVFTRVGADLFTDKSISLLEALSGTNYMMKGLDGKQFKITTLPGDIIEHMEVKCVKNKGMPFFKDAMGQGNLYVKFIV